MSPERFVKGESERTFKFCFHSQLPLTISLFRSNLRTLENKTFETRSTACRWDSGITCAYVLRVVPRSEWPSSDCALLIDSPTSVSSVACVCRNASATKRVAV